MSDPSPRRACVMCGESFARHELFPCAAIRETTASRILDGHVDWGPGDFICKHDLIRTGAGYVHVLLESERRELTSLEQEVLQSVRDHDLLLMSLNEDAEVGRTVGERLADRMARFGGSWTFILCFGAFLVAWVVVNTHLVAGRPPDPYPFILLNLVLSCLAAIQAPLIMMSQNRQEAKDRTRSQQDYRVNLKAELEIRHLHEKMDHLLLRQWDRMVEIQELQLGLLSEIVRGNGTSTPS